LAAVRPAAHCNRKLQRRALHRCGVGRAEKNAVGDILRAVLDQLSPEIPGLFVLIALVLVAFVALAKERSLESHKARLREQEDRRNERRGAVTSLYASFCDAREVVQSCLRNQGRIEKARDLWALDGTIEGYENKIERLAERLPPEYCDLHRQMADTLEIVMSQINLGKSFRKAASHETAARRASKDEAKKASDTFNSRVKPVVSHLWGKIEMAYPLGEKKKQLVGSCKTQRRTRHG